MKSLAGSACALLLALSAANSAPVCVVNHAGQDLLLALDDLSEQRETQWTADGGELCLPVDAAIKKVLVSVFISEDAIEGCSRIAKPGDAEILLNYANFDNCRWADR